MLSESAAEERRATRVAMFWLAALTLARLCIVGFVGLGDAEAYYWTWSRHLDLSYYDHPPMVSWMIAATTALGGDSPFFVRLGPVLLFAGTTFFVWKLACEVSGSRRAGLVALLMFQLTPAFAIGGQGANPDVPLGFFWSLSMWVLWRATTADRRALAWPAGLLLGLAFLSKYFALLFAVAAFLWLLRREHRHWFRRPELYAAMLLALGLAAPVILWNVQHDWPSVRYHLVNRHSAAAVSFQQIGLFLGGQGLYYSPLLWGGYLFALWVACKRGLRGVAGAVAPPALSASAPDRRRAFAFLATLSLPPLVFFTLIGCWTPQAEPHWTAMGYLPLVIAAAMVFEEKWPRGTKPSRRFRNYVYVAAGLPAVLLVGAHLHLLSSWFVPLIPERDRPRDLMAETTGWPQVGERTREVAAKMERLSGRAPLLVHYHYTKCSQLWFAVGGQLPLVCLNDRVDQFDFWQDERTLLGRDMLYVTDSVYKRRPETVWRFDRCTEEAPLESRRGPYLLRTFFFHRCEGYRGPVEGRKDL